MEQDFKAELAALLAKYDVELFIELDNDYDGTKLNFSAINTERKIEYKIPVNEEMSTEYYIGQDELIQPMEGFSYETV